jgi:hypothetical protein
MDGVRLEAVYDRNRIVALLRYSKDHGTVLGIHSPVLGGGVYITAVNCIITGEETTVVLSSYDSSGNILTTSKLKLADIRCVFPFQSVFENPYTKDLRWYTAA